MPVHSVILIFPYEKILNIRKRIKTKFFWNLFSFKTSTFWGGSIYLKFHFYKSVSLQPNERSLGQYHYETSTHISQVSSVKKSLVTTVSPNSDGNTVRLTGAIIICVSLFRLASYGSTNFLWIIHVSYQRIAIYY